MMNGERQRLLRRERRSVQYQSGIEGREKCKVRLACATILLAEILERVTFYSIAGNLVLFLNKKPYLWMSYNAANASFFLFGVSYSMSLVGGWVADSLLGKARTILVSFVIYLGGCAFLPFLSWNSDAETLPGVCGNRTEKMYTISQLKNPFDESCAWAVYLALFIVAIGVGAVKATIAPFGADQLKNSGQKAMRVFFNWFYWCVNLGAFIALGGIAYLQQQYHFFWGYLVACCCLGAATLLFLFGCTVYVSRPPSGSILTNVCKVLCESCTSSRGRSSSDREWFTNSRGTARVGFLDRAKMQYGGRFTDGIVEDVKSLLKILCVFVFMVPYWMVYYQMETTFYIQGLHMRLTFSDSVNWFTLGNWSNSGNCCNPGDWCNPGNWTNPEVETPDVAVAWLSLFDVVFVIMLIPVMDRLVYPRLDKAGCHFSMAKRMMVGMGVATIAVAVAGAVETRRLQIFWPIPNNCFINATIFQNIGNTRYQAANMSVFWQIPQYALIGISEVFTSIAALEFAYSKAPRSMKGIIMGMFFFFSGVGSLLGTALMYVFDGIWFLGVDYGNINARNCTCNSSKTEVIQASHLDYYFYFLAGLEVVSLLLFIVVVKYLNFHVDGDPGRSANQRRRINASTSEDFFSGQGRPSVRTGLLYGDT
ncbi:solute carrier family 15 member 4-like [Liolophura sinensis]|uniref:solute carrier family 15 member 4-like n=1 Tax=Liolophura sinensis TaxID=3198878 RepID=UPI0031585999